MRKIYAFCILILVALIFTVNQRLYAQCTPGPVQNFTNNTPVAIPTGPGVVTSTLNVAGAPAYLYDVNLTTFITHTFAADLDITLMSPAGTIITLTTDNGGGFDNVFNGTVWDDDANPAGQVPYTSNNGLVTDHSYVNLVLASPLVPEEPLGAFIGENPNGTWTITISDDLAGDGGSLNSWTLGIAGLSSAPTLAPFVFTNNTPVAIPTGPGVVTSTILVSGAGTQLLDVNLTTFITHTFAADMDITIMSPAGTVVTLTTDNGGGFDNVYNGTVWDDDANPAGQVPYVTNNGVTTDHSYVNLVLASPLTPEEALAAFVGENPNGTWTITISDDLGGDGGSLNSWTLNIQTSTCGCVAPTITTHPANTTVCEGSNTTFTVTAGGTPPFTYQWQINQGSGFVNLANVSPFSGVNTATLTISPTGTVYNTNQFRVLVSNACGGPITSNSATLTVNPRPTITVGPGGQCAPVTLVASGNSDTYSWSPATGLNTTTGSTVIASPTITTTYTVTGTITATGCTNSASVTVLGTPPAPVVTPNNPTICAGTIQPLTVPGLSSTFNGGALTIPSSGNANPYPSSINVSGLPTSGVNVQSVTINGFAHTFPDDVDIVLVSPTGVPVVLMSDVGGSVDNTGQNFTFQDGAPLMSFTGFNGTGTYRPSNDGAADTWGPPGPGALNQANPQLSSFTGNPNGNWGLYVVDDLGGDLGTISSWSITFSIPVARWSPAAGLYMDANATIPYVLGTPVITVYFLQNPTVTTQYTYTVTNVLGTCSSAFTTVTITVNPQPTLTVSASSCGPATLTASGNYNTIAWTPTTGLFQDAARTIPYTGQNLSTVYAANPQLDITYTATATLSGTGCIRTANVTVYATPAAPIVTPTSMAICVGGVVQLTAGGSSVTTLGGGAIQILDATAGNPYPSTIAVSGLPAGGVRVKSVNLTGFSHTFPSDVDMVLQSPTGTNVIIMSDAGGSTTANNVNLVLDDAAAASIPTVLVSGTYKPTNIGVPDNFVAPGPGSISGGSLLSDFSGNLNGTWRLFVVDDAGADVGTITNWSITFELVGALWSPASSLFINSAATVPYVAGTYQQTVWAMPATTTTYSVTRATANCTSAATQVTVTVYQPITVTTQPASQTVCSGSNVTFSVVTAGNFQSYQWQVSTGGGPFVNIPAASNPTAVTSSLVLNAVTTAMSGNQYRVVVTNTCSTVTSNAATLTVNPMPVVIATDLFNNRVCLSDTVVTLLGTPSGGTWSGVGVVGSNFIPNMTAVGNYVLTYTYTNNFGCTASDTTRVFVQSCPERARRLIDDAVILYPNPNNGRFNIRMNSTLYNYLGMRVYTEGGHVVATSNFTGLYYGRIVPIDLKHLPAGAYVVKIFYDDGVRTSEKSFKVIIGRD